MPCISTEYWTQTETGDPLSTQATQVNHPTHKPQHSINIKINIPCFFSSGQADVSPLARLHQVEQEKAVLAEQLLSAQSTIKSLLESEGQKRSATNTADSTQQTEVSTIQSDSTLQYSLNMLICHYPTRHT